jgi:hypothetical protein
MQEAGSFEMLVPFHVHVLRAGLLSLHLAAPEALPSSVCSATLWHAFIILLHFCIIAVIFVHCFHFVTAMCSGLYII